MPDPYDMDAVHDTVDQIRWAAQMGLLTKLELHSNITPGGAVYSVEVEWHATTAVHPEPKYLPNPHDKGERDGAMPEGFNLRCIDPACCELIPGQSLAVECTRSRHPMGMRCLDHEECKSFKPEQWDAGPVVPELDDSLPEFIERIGNAGRGASFGGHLFGLPVYVVDDLSQTWKLIGSAISEAEANRLINGDDPNGPPPKGILGP